LTNTITAIRQVPGYADFLIAPVFADIVSALPPATPLVYLVTTEAGGLALVVTSPIGATRIPTTTVHPLWLNDSSQSFLLELLQGAADNPNLGGWFGAYNQWQTNRPAWFAAIDQGTAKLWGCLMTPLSQHLTALNVQQAILIPTGYLGLLPLHAAWTPDPTAPTGRRYAFDTTHFTYAPNAHSLKAAQTIASRIKPDSLLAIDEPNHTGASPLPNSQREIDTAIATFPQHQRLGHAQATAAVVLAALPHHTVLHFSCHGFANLEEPLNSGLALANEDILTLRDILSLRLTGVRLAVLSACETGLSGTNLPDEVVSLPAGLLQAGVAGVAASLWSVSDFSTLLLLTRFYDLWRIEGLAIDRALRQAQQWVRDTTNRKKVLYFQRIADGIGASAVSRDVARFLYVKPDGYQPNQYSFAHPYHWAAFIVIYSI
jgi:CHAT domain-containing protein